MDDLRTQQKGKLLEVKDLPTLPEVLEEVNRLVEDPSSSTEQIARVISRDQVLSAKVLKMVNSPIYGFPRRIGTIQHALVLLGFNVVRGLIIGTSVFDAMNKSMSGLWEHSLACAVACTRIAQKLGKRDPEEYSLGGLLHDLGKVVAALQLPELKDQIDTIAKEKNITYLQAEKEVLGFGHDRINAWIADHWNLPVRLKEALAYHHRPLSAEFYPDMAQIVHLANFLARVFEIGYSGDDQVSYLQEGVLEALGLNLAGLDELMSELESDFMDLSGFSS